MGQEIKIVNYNNQNIPVKLGKPSGGAGCAGCLLLRKYAYLNCQRSKYKKFGEECGMQVWKVAYPNINIIEDPRFKNKDTDYQDKILDNQYYVQNQHQR